MDIFLSKNFDIKIPNKLQTFWRKIKRFFRNLRLWFPVLISDEQFDHYYFYFALRHKLKLMEKHFRSKHCWAADGNKYADDIHKCVLVLNRLIEHDHELNAFINHDKKWGDIEVNSDPPDEDGFRKLNVYRTKVTPETHDQEIKESKRLWEHSNNMIKQDIEYLFKMIQKHIQSWWD